SAKQTFEEADDVLKTGLSRLCFEGPEEELKLTVNTQPAILATSLAAFRALGSIVELSPSWVAGHSLGEYSALVAAGSFSLADALRAVRERGKAMQEAVPRGEGAMAALIGMSGGEVENICEEISDDDGLVSPANYNSPGQIVIAGHRDRVKQAMALFKERGGKMAVELPVSAPFHCSLMEPAARRMEEVLKDIVIDSPNTVLINNAEAHPVTVAGQIAPSLVRQVTSPVLWENSVRYMIGEDAGSFIEIGPGKVLTGLIKRIDRSAETGIFGSPENLDAAVALIDETSRATH
ncbi:[acyl-carrier-protein] S-malonyltransferase, partial [bacterium]